LSYSVEAQHTLSYYQEQAQNNSPLLTDQANLAQAAQLEAQRIGALYSKPQITLTGAYQFSPIINKDNGGTSLQLSPNGADKYVGYDIAASNGAVYQGLVNVVQPLYSAKRVATATSLSKIQSNISENARRVASHDLDKLVADQYILCVQDIQQKQYLDTVLVLLEKQKLIVEKLTKASLLKQSDLALIEIEIQNQRGQLLNYSTIYKRDLLDLRILCGMSDTSFELLPATIITINTEEIRTSGFVERFKLDSLNTRYTQHFFELKYKPLLSAFVNGGFNAVYAPTIPSRFGMSAGLNFSMNLYDGHQKNISQQRTEILLHSSTAYKRNFNTQNDVRKTRILGELKSLDSRTILAQNMIDQYTKVIGYYRQEVMSGQLSILNYVITIRNMALAQRDLILINTNRQLLLNTYNYWNW